MMKTMMMSSSASVVKEGVTDDNGGDDNDVSNMLGCPDVGDLAHISLRGGQFSASVLTEASPYPVSSSWPDPRYCFVGAFQGNKTDPRFTAIGNPRATIACCSLSEENVSLSKPPQP